MFGGLGLEVGLGALDSEMAKILLLLAAVLFRTPSLLLNFRLLLLLLREFLQLCPKSGVGFNPFPPSFHKIESFLSSPSIFSYEISNHNGTGSRHSSMALHHDIPP